MKLCICVLLILVLISPSEGVSGVKIAGCSLILHGGHRVVGSVVIKEQGKNTKVIIRTNTKYSKLRPGKKVDRIGLHIHKYSSAFTVNPAGASNMDCVSAGPHLNYENVSHGPRKANKKNRHTGDLGNVILDAAGFIDRVVNDNIIKINGKMSILGRSIVLHEGTDDLGNGPQPGSSLTGNAGGRLACCTIGVISKE